MPKTKTTTKSTPKSTTPTPEKKETTAPRKKKTELNIPPAVKSKPDAPLPAVKTQVAPVKKDITSIAPAVVAESKPLPQAQAPVVGEGQILEVPPDVRGLGQQLESGRDERVRGVKSDELNKILSQQPQPGTVDKVAEAKQLWDTIAQAGQQGQTEEDEDPNETNASIPAEVQEVNKKVGGLFGTEPKLAREAKPYDEPSLISKALGWTAAQIPIVGGPLSTPLLLQYKKRNVQMAKDKEMDAMFWKALEDDPLYAKQLAKVPTIQDALQRHRGMSPEDIMELDASITEEGVVSRKHLKTLLDQGLRPEGGFKTEFGTLKEPERPSKFIMTKDGLIMDETTGKYSRPENEDRWDRTSQRVRSAFKGMSEDDVFLTTMAVISPAASRSKILKTSEGIYIYDKFTNKGRSIKMAPGARSPMWDAEILSSDGFTPDSVLLWNKNSATVEEAKAHSTILKFVDIMDNAGTSLSTMIAGESDPGIIKSIIQKFLGYFNVADRYPAGTPQLRVNGGQAQRGAEQRTVPAKGAGQVEQAPTKKTKTLGSATSEVEKIDNFFTDMIGD